MMWGYDGFGFGGGGMGIGMLLFWGVIIFGIVMLVRGFGATSGSHASEPAARAMTPLDILGERYARGEIDKNEFEQKRSDLGPPRSIPMERQRHALETTARAETK